jgi:hypothetical protein
LKDAAKAGKITLAYVDYPLGIHDNAPNEEQQQERERPPISSESILLDTSAAIAKVLCAPYSCA